MRTIDRKTRILLAFLLLAATAPGTRASEGGHDPAASGAAPQAFSPEIQAPTLKGSSACTREEDPWGSSPYQPHWTGCLRGTGGCYRCEYTEGSITYTCFESPDGEEVFCLDFQDIPF
jgi:hypothetical protein